MILGLISTSSSSLVALSPCLFFLLYILPLYLLITVYFFITFRQLYFFTHFLLLLIFFFLDPFFSGVSSFAPTPSSPSPSSNLLYLFYSSFGHLGIGQSQNYRKLSSYRYNYLVEKEGEEERGAETERG